MNAVYTVLLAGLITFTVHVDVETNRWGTTCASLYAAGDHITTECKTGGA